MCVFDTMKLNFREDLKSGRIKKENLVEVDDIVFSYKGKPVSPFNFLDDYSFTSGWGSNILYGEFLPNYRIRFHYEWGVRTANIKLNLSKNYHYFNGSVIFWDRQILLTKKGIEKMKRANGET